MTTNELASDLDRTLLDSKESARERLVLSLHARRGQELYGFALGLRLPADDAADAVQETMLRLWRELVAAREVHDVDAWAFRTLYHLAVDHHRLRLRITTSLHWLGVRGTDAAPDPATLTDAAALWQAVDGLPVRQRAVLYLRYRVDLPFDRIALVLGISSGAARSHASAALATLRRRLEREES